MSALLQTVLNMSVTGGIAAVCVLLLPASLKRAPRWMQKTGVEFLHRLLSEPRRLWRRYLIMAPRFVWLVATGGRGA